MLLRIIFVLATLLCYTGVNAYSSFWAPLFNPRILNYRVDIPFDPDAGKNARASYEKKYGFRGEKLIAEFGNGRRPRNEGSTDIKFYYTYKGADKNEDNYSP